MSLRNVKIVVTRFVITNHPLVFERDAFPGLVALVSRAGLAVASAAAASAAVAAAAAATTAAAATSPAPEREDGRVGLDALVL